MATGRRSPARAPRIRRVRAHGQYQGQGPQVEDAVSGWYFPAKDCVEQRGHLVSADERDGSLDKPDDY